ncbi:hypothetical protein CHUAL_001092, partial [Chamberlinius hualienensis]
MKIGRLLMITFLIGVSWQMIGAQHHSEDVDYFFGDIQRRADDEGDSDSGSVSTPDDPDGDGVVGTAGKDYPTLRRPPQHTSFTCQDKVPGIYADVETGCQVYHVCQSDERRESSLCVNGTVFNQESLACDWWYNVDCSASPRFYWVNDELGKQTVPKRDPEQFPVPKSPITSFIIDFPPLKKPSPILPPPPPPVIILKKTPLPPLPQLLSNKK